MKKPLISLYFGLKWLNLVVYNLPHLVLITITTAIYIKSVDSA